MYDNFFAHSRPYNKVIGKVLFSDEVIKNYGKLAVFSQQNAIQSDKQLGYEMKMPPQTYEQYKKLNQERQTNNGSLNNLNKTQQRQIQSASNKDREKSLGVQNTGHNTNSQEPNKNLRQGEGSQSRPLTGSNTVIQQQNS